MKVLSVFGTGPETIKMAPVVKALELCGEINNSSLATILMAHLTVLRYESEKEGQDHREKENAPV